MALGRGCPRCGYSLEASLGGVGAADGSRPQPGPGDLAENGKGRRSLPGRRERCGRPWRKCLREAPLSRWVSGSRACSTAVPRPAVDSWGPAGPRGRSRPARRLAGNREAHCAGARCRAFPPRVTPASAARVHRLCRETRRSRKPGPTLLRSSPRRPRSRRVWWPPQPNSSSPDHADDADHPGTETVWVQSESGLAGRLNGDRYSDRVSATLDGQLGLLWCWSRPTSPSASTSEEMGAELLAGPFAGFHVFFCSSHYLVLYKSTPEFADASLRLLENLYRGLTEAFRKRGIPVHDLEFPLWPSSSAPRPTSASSRSTDVQAYYEISQPHLLLRAVGPRRAFPRGRGAAQAADRRPRGDAPDPPEHRRPAPPGRLAALAGRGAGRVLLVARDDPERGEAGAASAWSTRCTWRRSATWTTRSRSRSAGAESTRIGRDPAGPWSNTS